MRGGIVIGTAIGTLAELNRKEVLIPLICGFLFMELMFAGLRFLYNRQARKNGKQNLKTTPFIYRFQSKSTTIMIFPPVHKICDTKKIIRHWLTQLVLATAHIHFKYLN